MKKTTIEQVLTQAREQGACGETYKATSWKTLAWLFFSPQGQEFCEKHQFPTSEIWSEIKASCEAERYDIFINCGKVNVGNAERVAFIGATEGECTFSLPEKAHTVVLMNGAKAHIKADNYAVVRIIKTADSEVRIEKDDTAKILW